MGSPRRSGARALAALALASLAMAACTSEEPPEVTPTASGSSAEVPTTSAPPSSPSTPPPSTTAAPSIPEGFSTDEVASPTFPDLGGDLGGVGVVRVGRHSTYDRVVWEFPGPGRPTFRVRYVDEPTADGSGEPVDVRGDAYLEVMITFVSTPAAGATRPADAGSGALAGTVIAEANAIYGGYEGYGQAFVGVRDRERPFRVFVLSAPTRLVVDVATG